MKRAGYRPYQGERTPEITHPMNGRGTHRACFIYHVINMVAVNSYEQGDSVRAEKYRKRNPSSFLPPLVYNKYM